MNIIFEYLEVQNFKSIGECITFNYKDFSGLNFIIGTNLDQPGSKNGSGKSVLTVDALVFALFGRTLKNTNNSYIQNRYCSKKLETFSKITFSVDNVRYRSESYIKNSSTVKMLLFKENDNEETGWEDLTQCSVIKTRQYIQEHILNCTFDIFKTAIIIAASDCLNFYEGMNKNQKRLYIENMFNLNCFGDMYAFAKSDLNDIKKEISYSNNEIINITENLSGLKLKSDKHNEEINNSLDELKAKIVSNAEKYKKLSANLDRLVQSLNNYENIDVEYNICIGNLKETTDKLHKVEHDCTKASCKIESLKNAISDFNKLKAMACEDNILDLKNKYDTANKEYNNLLEKYSLLNKDLNNFSNIEELLKNINSQILERNTVINNLNSELLDIKSKVTAIQTAKQEVDDIKTVLCKDCTDKINIKFDYNTKEKAIKKLNEKISLLTDNINKNNIIINDLNIQSADTSNKLKEKQKLISDINILKNDIKYKLNEVNKLKSDYEKIENKANSINNTFDCTKKEQTIKLLEQFIIDKNTEKTNFLNIIKELNIKINNFETLLKNKNDVVSNISLIKSDIKYIKADIINLKKSYTDTQLKTTNNPFIDLINDTENKLSDEQNKIKDLNDNALHIEILKDIFSENGVKKHIIKNLVSVLNSLIQKYLSEIGAEFLVCFDETFEFKFITLNGECEYSNFSAGEKQRIQIATMLAFRDLILNGKINSNILIIDEMLDQAVDSIAIKKITNILQRKSIELNQATFVISHRSEITEDNIFNHIIEVIKENGISTINVI